MEGTSEEKVNAPKMESSDVDCESNCDGAGNISNSSALGDGLYSLISSVMSSFESNAESTVSSQDQLDSALDRLTQELDKLLEDAPSPFIMQHAARISGVRKRITSLNTVLKSMQRRIDNMDRLISAGSHHGAAKTAVQTSEQ